MTAEQYARISAPFRTPGRTRLLNILNRSLTGLCYVLYPLLLVYLAIQWDARILRALIIPAIAFVLLSIVRKRINFPRPYQVLEIRPLIHKDTKGKSMPSRHVFCVFMIAMTYLWIVPRMGILLLAVGVLLAAVRVIGGVHFPRDVLVGAAVGIAAGLLGYWLL